MTKKAPYGYCPICSCEGETRERRLDGDDRCQEGHTYPSRRALSAPKAVAPAAPARTDAEIVRRTEELAAALNYWRWGGRLTSGTYRDSENTKAQWCWQMA